MLLAICSGYELEIEKFKDYCQETSRNIVDLYPWYPLPPAVHKMLEHSADIASSLELPIGFYSEESQEALNKEIRKARLNHTAKTSRFNIMKN